MPSFSSQPHGAKIAHFSSQPPPLSSQPLVVMTLTPHPLSPLPSAAALAPPKVSVLACSVCGRVFKQKEALKQHVEAKPDAKHAALRQALMEQLGAAGYQLK